MPTFEAARRLVLEHAAPLAVESVPLLEAAGRVLASGGNVTYIDHGTPWTFAERVATSGRSASVMRDTSAAS